MNIVRFDVNEVLANGEVVLLHVTQDKPVTTEFADNLTNFTAWNIDNNRKFTFVRYEGGFTLDQPMLVEEIINFNHTNIKTRSPLPSNYYVLRSELYFD